MSEPPSERPVDDESERLYAWRYRYALELGFDFVAAEQIAAGRDDLHALEAAIEELVDRGCPRPTARRIAR